MKLIALILGLILERLVTELLHLRQLHWFDHYFDFAIEQLQRVPRSLLYPGVLVALLLPVVPVYWASVVLASASTQQQFPQLMTTVLWTLPYVLFAVVILFFSLGPRDLGSEVDEYCEAVEADDAEASERVLTELCEVEHTGTSEIDAVEEAIFVQATNRIFGVVFWFIALGPVGAWLFRASDLFRRRLAYRVGQQTAVFERCLAAVDNVHGVLVWLPARLAILGYALSGSFDDALNCWRSYELKSDLPFHRSNDEVVACVGKAAMTGFLEQTPNSSAAARNAMRLVHRTLFIWITVIGLMTIFGWAV
jgi:membrane protein required for beta-lactamase induction